MAKVFSVGDAVFAKVRGYPPWPARVSEIVDVSNSKRKYRVIFYGTLETALCKQENIHGFEDNKEKYGKPSKRVGFNKALSEIEDFINNKAATNKRKKNDIPVTKQPNGKKKGAKRKRENKFEHTGSKTPKRTHAPPLKRLKRGSVPNTVVANVAKAINGSPSKQEIVRRSGRKIKPNKIADEDCEPSSSNIGGDTSRKSPIDASNKKLLHGLSVASTSADTQKQVRLRVKTPEALNNSVQENHSLQEANNFEQRYSRLSDEEKKEAKLEWLQIEASMLKTEFGLNVVLGVDKTDIAASISHLTHLSNLPIEPLMLKKHPIVLDTIRKLRRYVGNADKWNLTQTEEEKFNSDALQIRKMSVALYNKFMSMFTVPRDVNFSDFFEEAVTRFQIITESFSGKKFSNMMMESSACEEDLSVEEWESEPETEACSPSQIPDSQELTVSSSAENSCAMIVEPSARSENLSVGELELQPETEATETCSSSQIPDSQELPRVEEMQITLSNGTIKSEPAELEAASDIPSLPAIESFEIGMRVPKTEEAGYGNELAHLSLKIESGDSG